MLVDCLTHKALITLVFTSGVAGCDLKLKVKQPPLKTTPIAKNMSTEALELIIFNRVNQYRLSQNLKPVKLHPRITELAREHSRKMAKGEVPFSHNGFEDRVKAISIALPYQGASENVAYNYGYQDPAQYTISGWINSPGHQKNMVGKYNLTGIGVAKNYKGEYYFTQIFVNTP
ncbi:CAP domain-containing protein [Merismopedia glauca CCAP 1448/3]|uniref:CAP domain-containing protein n=2 Tax=Merismopedia TaxID=53402 RepID=A0A2T1BXK2_9CYAN|nr:CAP domain-containing protein [Merismopedia glauca CCAP 1448/3]